MVEDLRRQASELYRERTEKEGLPTSDSLSMKKLIYISLGVLLLLVVVIQVFGGFRKHPNPILAGSTPAQIIKETPPPELLQSAEKTPAKVAPDRVEAKLPVPSQIQVPTSQSPKKQEMNKSLPAKQEVIKGTAEPTTGDSSRIDGRRKKISAVQPRTTAPTSKGQSEAGSKPETKQAQEIARVEK